MQTSAEDKIAQAEEIRRLYEPHPSDFIQDAFKSQLWSMQSEITEAVFKYPSVAVKTCNAAGKSYTAARIALAFLTLKPGSIVITTAPTWRQVKDVLWREIRTALALTPFKITEGKINQVGIELGPDWFAVGLSTKDSEKFFGYHADDILVIVDEASGVEEEIFIGVDAVTPNLNAHVLMIGNPTNPEGRFYKAFTNKFVKSFTVTAFDTPNLAGNGIHSVEDLIALFTPPEGTEDELEYMTEVQKKLVTKPQHCSLISPLTVFKRYHEWGPDHPSWESLIMAQFPSQSEFSLIPLNVVEKSQAMWRQIVEMDKLAKSSKPEDLQALADYKTHMDWDIQREGILDYGLDIARYGGDSTVLTPRRGGFADKQQVWAKLPTDITTDFVIDAMNLEDWRAVVKPDDTGLGGGVTDQLLRRKRDDHGERYHFRVIPINFSAGTNFPDEFFNLRSEMYWYLRELLVNHKIAIPDDEELRDELVAIRFKYVGKDNNIIRVEPKEEMKKRLRGKSPDKADSLMLAFFDLPNDRWTMSAPETEKFGTSDAEISPTPQDDLEADPMPSGFGMGNIAGEGNGLRFDEPY